jgi:hypothetical protein
MDPTRNRQLLKDLGGMRSGIERRLAGNNPVAFNRRSCPDRRSGQDRRKNIGSPRSQETWDWGQSLNCE